MHKPKAITDFANFTEEELRHDSGIIVNQLTLNVLTFPGLTVAPATLGTQVGDYTTVLDKPNYAGKGADVQQKRDIVEASLKSDGNIVNTIAKGDSVILAKSGYPISKPHQPIGPLAQSTLDLTPTKNTGEFSYEITGVRNADGFLICITTNDNREEDFHKWQWFWCPKTRGIINGLAGSIKYKAVSLGVGTDLLLTPSNVIFRTTQ